MEKDAWDERRRALEEGYFTKRNHELTARMHEAKQHEGEREELIKLTGLESPSLLESLVAAGIVPETLSALNLVPLFHVAWADGTISTKEEELILRTAPLYGIFAATPAHDLLQAWLREDPGWKLFEAWEAYMEKLAYTMEETAFRKLAADLMERARQVAESSGGLFDMAFTISDSERLALSRIGESLSHQ